MDIMQPIDQATALSSFPVIKEARVNIVASTISMSTERSSIRTSGLSISETSKNPLREKLVPSERSATHSLEQERIDDSIKGHAIRKYKSSDLLKLETDRESVINLAKFLRTTDPPPNNYMSVLDAGQRDVHGKKLPFKILRRQSSSKKSSDTVTRTLRLPDSAVAAKTSKGHWHIAISIPVEYDHQESNAPTQHHNTKHAKTQSETAIQKGPIIVRKPVIGNVRPVAIERVHTKSQSHDDLCRTFASARPISVPLFKTEAMRASQMHYDHKTNPDEPHTTDVEHVQYTHPLSRDNGVPGPDATRPHSQRSELRKSEDTTSTARTFESTICHTRGQSSISTAPSVNYPASPRAIWPHKRHASGSNHVLDQSEQSLSAQLSHSFLDTPVDDSIRPTSVGSDMSSANLKIAATAQGYGPDMPGTQVVFVRKGTQIPSYRARMARRTPKNSSAEYILSSQSIVSRDYAAAPPNSVDVGGMTKGRQSRRERVKAIRSRDMARLRAMKKYQQVMASVTGQEVPITLASPTSPAASGQRAEICRRQAQKRSLSYASIAEETTWQKGLNALTPIMIVADLEPSTASSDISVSQLMLVADLEPSAASPEPSVHNPHFSTHGRHEKEGRMSMKNSPDEVQTPPCSTPPSPISSEGQEMRTRDSPAEAQILNRSIAISPASPDTETIQSLKPRPRMSSASNLQRNSNDGNHLADLRSQKSLTDESMDIRMKRLETINAVIFRTLNAVVEMGVGFRELRQLLPAESTELNENQSCKGYNAHNNEDRDPVGSLIRELRGAVKIGQEELAKYGAGV